MPRMVVRTVACALVCIALLASCLNKDQETVYDALMADRTEHGLAALALNMQAQHKAQVWAEKLASEDKLYHSTLSDGITTRWCSLGENVGYGPNAQSIQDAYMGSSGHRANILSTKWNGVGVGYATNGRRVFTVQVFIRTC